jgi:hypothetical protein
MNFISCYCQRFHHRVLSSLSTAALLWLVTTLSVHGATTGKTFATPEEAVNALATAVNHHDTNALAAIFGSGIEELKSADPVQAQHELDEFAEQLNSSNHIDHVAKGRCVLEIGKDRWPFAIPLVQNGAAWSFDLVAGKEELLNRRIGNNELSTLRSIRAYVDAQRQYASKDRDGDGVLEFAQNLTSTPGKMDGLYWSADQEGEESPLGPLFAVAHHEGYFKEPMNDSGPRPFHGYLFKILTQQGPHAPGGAYSYIINGNMIGGFALVAWPAEYGNSGVMTFIINQQGKAYQRDLGPNTQSIVTNMNTYDPDPDWTPSRE